MSSSLRVRRSGSTARGGITSALIFAAEAELPALWECPRCGAESLRSDGDRAEAKDEKPARTHWDMLRERRSIAELEDLLAERLDLLRSGELGPNYAATNRSSRRPPDLGHPTPRVLQHARSRSVHTNSAGMHRPRSCSSFGRAESAARR